MVDLGCLCMVDKRKARDLGDTDTFELDWLNFKTLANHHYLPEKSFRQIFFYHHRVGTKAMFGLFFAANKRASVFVLDTVRSNQMPNLVNMYNAERNLYAEKHRGEEGLALPEEGLTFEVRVETELRQVHRQIQRLLAAYKDERKGPTVIVTQSIVDFQVH